jgi:methyl-accepting chemotaxis protein
MGNVPGVVGAGDASAGDAGVTTITLPYYYNEIINTITTINGINNDIEDINHIADKSYQAMSSIAEASQNLTILANQQGDLVHQFKL